jgi:hypothetical protein
MIRIAAVLFTAMMAAKRYGRNPSMFCATAGKVIKPGEQHHAVAAAAGRHVP